MLINPQKYFDKFTNDELCQLAMEINLEFIPMDALIRTCTIDIFGTNGTLIQMIGISPLICRELAIRLKSYNG